MKIKCTLKLISKINDNRKSSKKTLETKHYFFSNESTRINDEKVYSVKSTPTPWLTLLLVPGKVVLSKIHVNQVS